MPNLIAQKDQTSPFALAGWPPIRRIGIGGNEAGYRVSRRRTVAVTELEGRVLDRRRWGGTLV
jgi:hypothetical protein